MPNSNMRTRARGNADFKKEEEVRSKETLEGRKAALLKRLKNKK